MTEKGLYIPTPDGSFKYQGAKAPEDRPALTYEHDTGRLLLNFNMIFTQNGRKLQDIVTITEGGRVMGLMLTSTAMGPEELARLKKTEGTEKL